MTLLDAPEFNQARARTRRGILIVVLCLFGVLSTLVYLCWNLPAERVANRFLAAVEAQDFPKAFGIWNNDPGWQQHAQQYAAAGYSYGRFVVDWGTSGEYGRITRHKIRHSTRYGNNALLAVEINGRGQALMTLAVADRLHTMTFPPFALTQVSSGLGWNEWQVSPQ